MNTRAISNGNIVEERKLVGRITGDSTLEGTKLVGKISEEPKNLTGSLATAYLANIEHYTGTYEVIPKSTEQSLQTKYKYMSDDVSVHAIPYFEVGNTAGGNTVYIGGEIDIE